MAKEGFAKIVSFMIPGTGVLVLEHSQIRQIVKMHDD